MPPHLRRRGRPAATTALLFTMALSALTTGLLPVTAAQAADATAPATTATTATATVTPDAPAATVTPDAPAATVTPDARSSEPTAPVKPAEAPAGSAASTTSASSEECPALPLASFGGELGDAEGLADIPVGDAGSDCFTFTAEKPGLHQVLVDENKLVYSQVLDGETVLECGTDGTCDLPRAGEYTLRVVNSGWEARQSPVSVTPLNTTAGCTEETGTAWNLPAVTGTATSTVGLVCHRFTGTPGERVLVDFRTTSYGQAFAWITDETGAVICPNPNQDGNEGCVLPGDGPYRIIGRVSYAGDGYPAEYSLAVRRLSDPVGCADVPVNAFGSAPTAVEEATRCRTFTTAASGRYEVYGVSEFERTPLTVYDRDGLTVCESWNQPCSLPAGTYTALTHSDTLILDRTSSDGCVPVELGVANGEFTAVAETDCLTLPHPAGSRLAVLEPQPNSGPNPTLTVVDANGASACSTGSPEAGNCLLTGTAPFRLLVSAYDESDTGSYRLALFRTDVANDCPVLPVGTFAADSPRAKLTLGDGVFARCLSIPAGDHGAVEVFQLKTLSGGATSQFSVVGDDGGQPCSVRLSLATWTSCALKPGVAYTVLFSGRDLTGEYGLTRSDVTAGAQGCAATPATAVGGPSTGGTLAAPGELRCHQVTTGQAGDVLHLDVRDQQGGANHLAFDAEGKVVCQQRNVSCAVSGSTSYQVLVTVPSSLKASGPYRLDALRIGTPSGPAPECVKVPNVAYGYGPITGTLDEEHTAVCAALPTAYRDTFDFKVENTAGGTATPVPALYDASLGATGCTRFVPDGYQCSVNEPYTSAVTPSILVVGLPDNASSTAYKATLACTTSLCGTERITVSGAYPATGASGSKVTVTVTGTSLHEDDVVELSVNGTARVSTGTKVAADRRSMTTVLDLTGVPAESWSFSVLTHNGGRYPRGSFMVTAPTSEPGMHDYDSDGEPDLLARDAGGLLWMADVNPSEGGAPRQGTERIVGTAWQVYNRIEAVGNVGGAAHPDLVARDAAGVLWLYLGTGKSTGLFSSPIRVGGGWNTYSELTGGSDLTGDGKPDLVATDTSGVLWLYEGTGSYSAPFAARVKVGAGWGVYDRIVATGDIAGATAGDLVARDRDGVLWLYLGYGNGTFAPRTKIGGGWNAYRDLVAYGDADRDGRPDLYATQGWNDGPAGYHYHATGAWQTPFGGRVSMAVDSDRPGTYEIYI